MAEPKVEPASEPVADPLPPGPSPAPEPPDEGAPKVEEPAPEPEAVPLTEVPIDPSDVVVRSASKREIEVRLLPWDTQIETTQGPEEFRQGATVGTPDDAVLLMGLEHEAKIKADPSAITRTIGSVPDGRTCSHRSFHASLRPSCVSTRASANAFRRAA